MTTYTENEIESALTLHRRNLDNASAIVDALWGAATRTNIDGSYDFIAEQILRTHIAELAALPNALLNKPMSNAPKTNGFAPSC